MFRNILGHGRQIEEAMFPLIPPPPFKEEELGADWRQWVKEYRDAITAVMAKQLHKMIKREINAANKTSKITELDESRAAAGALLFLRDQNFYKLRQHFDESPDKKLNKSEIYQIPYRL